MTTALLWSRPLVPAEVALVHALVIGVSGYDFLPGGSGPTTSSTLLAGLGQLSAAATSAARVGVWLRDHFDFPDVPLGSVRLLASPVDSELPLPGGLVPPPATFDQVRLALNKWRADARRTPGNVALLYVAGHGIQTGNNGGILLLQDVGYPDEDALSRAVDVWSVREGMVGDPTEPGTSTPPVQYYFYDACRVQPAGVSSFERLQAGLGFSAPRGVAAEQSRVLWGSRSRDYALADTEARVTLFSKALLQTLETGAPTEADGRTVRFGLFQSALEDAVDELAKEAGEVQTVQNGGTGQNRIPIYLRPLSATVSGVGPSGLERGHDVDLEPVVVATRPVTVSVPDGGVRGLTVRGSTEAGVEVLRGGTTGAPISLPAGRYTVSVNQPWGGSVRVALQVPAGIATMSVPVEVPAQQPGSLAGAPRAWHLLGPAGGADMRWCLRFLSWTPGGLRYLPTTPVQFLETHVHDGTVSILLRFEDRTDAAQYAQIRTVDGRSLVVALPVRVGAGCYEPQPCWLHVRASESTLGAAVRLVDPTIDSPAGLLTGGRPDLALQTDAVVQDLELLEYSVTDPGIAEQLLHDKLRDPIGATIGGYALLRLNELDRIHGWADNLSRFFDWLPDGAVIAAETAGRRGEDDHALRRAQTAVWRGIPLFTEGLSLLGDRVRRLIGDETLDAQAREELRMAAEPVVSLVPYAEFGAMASTLRIDPDPGEVTGETGWREFIPTVVPEDPRNYWRAP